MPLRNRKELFSPTVQQCSIPLPPVQQPASSLPIVRPSLPLKRKPPAPPKPAVCDGGAEYALPRREPFPTEPQPAGCAVLSEAARGLRNLPVAASMKTSYSSSSIVLSQRFSEFPWHLRPILQSELDLTPAHVGDSITRGRLPYLCAGQLTQAANELVAVES